MTAAARRRRRGRRLNAELDNVRRALEWFVERGDAEAALSLSVGTGWLFFTRADFHQGARWVADALGVPGDVPERAALLGPRLARLLPLLRRRVRRPRRRVRSRLPARFEQMTRTSCGRTRCSSPPRP